MSEVRIDDLLRLAEHLEKDALGHAQFDFGCFNDGNKDKRYYQKERLQNCRTLGCALGECPFVFPQWYFKAEDGYPSYRGYGPWTSAEHFFKITMEEVLHLFCPYKQEPERYGGVVLGQTETTSKDVARNIRAFCDIVKLTHY